MLQFKIQNKCYSNYTLMNTEYKIFVFHFYSACNCLFDSNSQVKREFNRFVIYLNNFDKLLQFLFVQ